MTEKSEAAAAAEQTRAITIDEIRNRMQQCGQQLQFFRTSGLSVYLESAKVLICGIEKDVAGLK